jgi:hypothetical protein
VILVSKVCTPSGTEFLAQLELPEISTCLYHEDYREHKPYFMGVADMVGYWAEVQIFGGFVWFHHGE